MCVHPEEDALKSIESVLTFFLSSVQSSGAVSVGTKATARKQAYNLINDVFVIHPFPKSLVCYIHFFTLKTGVLKRTIGPFLTTCSRTALLFFSLFWVQTSLRIKNHFFQTRFPSRPLHLNALSSFFVLVWQQVLPLTSL